MRRRTEQSGFTITELLIAISIGAMLSVLMMAVFIYGYGGLIVEQTRASMVLESQLFLKRMTEDIRLANQILPATTLADANGPNGGWITNDPANILIMTQPVTDNNNSFIYDSVSGYPYQNEIVYFSDGSNMYRRTLRNDAATGNSTLTTCPAGVSGCPRDVVLSEYLRNMTFVFRDVNDVVTTTAANARAVELTVNLERRVYGRTIAIQNSTRMTLRNEN